MTGLFLQLSNNKNKNIHFSTKLIFIEIVLYTCFYYVIILYERDILLAKKQRIVIRISFLVLRISYLYNTRRIFLYLHFGIFFNQF